MEVNERISTYIIFTLNKDTWSSALLNEPTTTNRICGVFLVISRQKIDMVKIHVYRGSSLTPNLD